MSVGKKSIAQDVKQKLFIPTGVFLNCMICFADIELAREGKKLLADEVVFEDITVTGSRIKRSGLTSPTPVTILAEEDLKKYGATNIGELLNELPAITPGFNRQNFNDFRRQGFNGNSVGGTFLNLRDLGTNRTLVLVDGRRHVGSQFGTSAVDVSTIPVSLLKRVEIITGGASAIYGSDAVSGVINFIMKDDFEGFQLDTKGGLSDHGDGETYEINITGGKNFADDRGNITFNIGYSDAKEIKVTDRDFAQKAIELWPQAFGEAERVFVGTKSLLDQPNTIVHVRPTIPIRIDQDLNLDPDGQFVPSFDDNGKVVPFDFGAIPAPIIGVFGLGEGRKNFATSGRIVSPEERLILNSRLRWEFSDYARLTLSGKYARTESVGAEFPHTNYRIIQPDNAFISPELKAIVGDRAFLAASDLDNLGLFGYGTKRDLVQLYAVLEGALEDNWYYNVYYSYGQVDFDLVTFTNLNESRLIQAQDAIVGPKGEIVCRDPSNGCIPINPFSGPSGMVLSNAQLNFIQVIPKSTGKNTIEQQVVSGYLEGEVFDLPAGPATVIGGFEYRDELAERRPSPVEADGDPNGGFLGSPSVIKGSYDVKEVFGEVRIPIVGGQPLIHGLGIEGAVRWADYSTAGSTITWKAGGEWLPVKDLRFRGTLSQAIRAPNIGENFQAASETSQVVIDPCSSGAIDLDPDRRKNCEELGIVHDPGSPNGGVQAGLVPVRTLTDADLDVETSDTVTFGIALTPRMVPNLTLTLDYWDIEIDDAISESFNAQEVVNACVDGTSLNDPFCDLVERNIDGTIASISTKRINVFALEARGYDMEANYRFHLEKLGIPGAFGLGLLATRLEKRDFININGSIDKNAGEIGRPKWRFTLDMSYALSKFFFNWQFRFLESTVIDVQSETIRGTLETGDITYSDVYIQYTFNQTASVYGGINNLFDKEPPAHPATYRGGAGGPIHTIGTASIYDTIGRFYYTGIRLFF